MNQKIDALLAGHRKFTFAPTAGGGGPETEDIRARMALVAVTRAPPGQTQRTAARVEERQGFAGPALRDWKELVRGLLPLGR